MEIADYVVKSPSNKTMTFTDKDNDNKGVNRRSENGLSEYEHNEKNCIESDDKKDINIENDNVESDNIDNGISDEEIVHQNGIVENGTSSINEHHNINTNNSKDHVDKKLKDNSNSIILPFTIAKIPFAQQLSCLVEMKLPNPKQIEALSIKSHKPLSDKTVNVSSSSSDSPHVLSEIAIAVDQILNYFKSARTVLSGLDGEDNVEWIYEGRQAVFDVGSTILCAGDIMNQMMNVLEECKVSEEDENKKERESNDKTNDDEKISKKHSPSLFLPVIDKIERAIKEWHDILDLVRYLRLQVDISTEWKDLYEQVLTDVNDEINKCATSIFETQEKLLSIPNSSDSIDIDDLITVMDESPYMGKIKLPSLSEFERELNRNYLEIKSRIKPLEASLNFVPIRIEQYSQKAKDIFPSSITAVQKKYIELESTFNQIVKDIDGLEKKLGEERWKSIFRKTGQKAVELLNTLQENLNTISLEQHKVRQGEKIDRVKMDRIATKNGYLMSSIARHISIIDRAIRDKFSITSDMYTVQSTLHRQWSSLLLAESKVIIDDDMIEGNDKSPCLGRGIANTHFKTEPVDLSINTTFSTSPSLSSPTTSPTPSINNRFRHIKTLSTEINPIRGLAIKFPSHKRKESLNNNNNINDINNTSSHSVASSTSSIMSNSSTTTTTTLPSSASSPLQEKDMSPKMLLSPTPAITTTYLAQEVVVTTTLSPPNSNITKRPQKYNSPVNNRTSPPSIISNSPTVTIHSPTHPSLQEGRNSRLSMRLSSPNLSLALPPSVSHSQIPVLSPERRTIATPSRTSSRLESRHSLTGALPESTPSRIPRPSSRLSDVGPSRRVSSRLDMAKTRTSLVPQKSLMPPPSTPLRETTRRVVSSSRIGMTPSKIARPSTNLETIQSATQSTHSFPTPRTVTKRVSSSYIHQTPKKYPIDRKVSLPSLQNNRPNSSNGSYMVPPLPTRPPWR